MCKKIRFPFFMQVPNVSIVLVVFGLVWSGPGAGFAANRGFEKLHGAVVRIDVREATFERGAKRTIRGVGSGVVMSKDGHVLTNAHVVSPQAEEISVTLANLERVDAALIGWDHWTDLALLRIDMDEVRRRGLSFSTARFGDSNQLAPGQTVFAVGTPNGLTRTVTKGIISNTKRYFAGSDRIRGHETGYFNTWLQTDAAINPGNSGGPLVTENGRVVGINTRSYLGANNLGFAVPSSTAHHVMQALMEVGEIVRSHIGIRPGPLQDLEAFFDLEINHGMLINSVDPGSPAAEGGLRAGDIVLAIDGRNVDGRFPEQLPPILNTIADQPVGATLTLSVKRGGELFSVVVITERLESRVGEKWAFEDWGLSVEKVSRHMAREQKLGSSEGVMVVGTQPAFPAAEAGLRRGDIITKVNRETVASLDQLRGIYSGYREAPGKILLQVMRYHQVSYYVLKP